MPAEKIEIFKRECIIRNSSEIIITENGSAVLYKVSDNSKFMTSNIFAARIMEYAPQLHSYFVDIGDERRALLNAPEGAHRLGSFCAVQIAAAARGKKGACVTSGIRLTGVYAVLLPTEDKPSVNISTKIKDGAVRERLAAAGKLLQPKYALILRTQAASASAAEIAEEYEKLVSVWHGIQRRLQSAAADGASRLLFAEDPVASALLKYPRWLPIRKSARIQRSRSSDWALPFRSLKAGCVFSRNTFLRLNLLIPSKRRCWGGKSF